MVDVTQSVACIQCGACVSSCLSMEADPDFIGPAALAKAYRFVGDPRDGQHHERLYDLANDPHGIYDCTHCFSCIDACPKGVAPMNQIMRLRRLAGDEHDDRRRQQRPPPRARLRQDHREEGHARRVDAAAGVLRPRHQGQADADAWRAIKGMIESMPTAIRGIRTGKMRSLPKLIPGVHHKLPGDAQDHVKRIYETRRGEPHRAQPLHHRRGRRGRGRSRRRGRARRRHRARARRAEGACMSQNKTDTSSASRRRAVKVAYWPGCVSRGFTPELHGSMALAADALGIEMVTLDRASCCGAGVIAEHNQELADSLNARTFALAQQTGLPMMNICSTCQGAQSECQERLDADSSYREHINQTLKPEGIEYVKGKDGWTQQELPLAAGRGLRPREARRAGQAAAERPPRRPLLRLLRAAPEEPPRLRGEPRPRPLSGARHRGARRRGRRLRRRPPLLRLPGDHDEPARPRCARPAPTSATRSTPAPTAW